MKRAIFCYLLLSITYILTAQNNLTDKIQEIKTNLAIGQTLDNDTIQLNNLLFETGSNQLSPSSINTLNLVLDLLRLYDNRANISIDGHTDDVGDAQSNQTLSEERAVSVANYLVNNGGVDINQVTIRGYGEQYPRVPNIHEEYKKLNRRVEVVASLRKDIKHIQANIIYLNDGQSIGCRNYTVNKDTLQYTPYDIEQQKKIWMGKVNYVSSVTGQEMTNTQVTQTVNTYKQQPTTTYTEPIQTTYTPTKTSYSPVQIPPSAKVLSSALLYIGPVRNPYRHDAMNVDFYHNPLYGSTVDSNFDLDKNRIAKGVKIGLELEYLERILLNIGGIFSSVDDRRNIQELEVGLGYVIGNGRLVVIPRTDFTYGGGKIYLGESFPSPYNVLINDTYFIDNVSINFVNRYVSVKPGASIRLYLGKGKRGLYVEAGGAFKVALHRKQYLSYFGSVPDSDDEDTDPDIAYERINLPIGSSNDDNVSMRINNQNSNYKVLGLSGIELKAAVGIRIFKR